MPSNPSRKFEPTFLAVTIPTLVEPAEWDSKIQHGLERAK